MTPSQSDNDITILLVDDRVENLISLEMMLEADNRRFIQATSGNEALKILLKNTDIGLIMLDVQMPDMDGFEVARILKSNSKTKDISIIFVTAINKEEQYVLKGFEQGAVDYLQKPLDIHVTRAKVSVFEHLYHYQHQLKKALSDIENVNRQLERFVYTVSHDLKSPLSGMATLISSMEYDVSTHTTDPKELDKNIHMMKNASTHLLRMVDAILDYSRKSMDQQTVEDVNVKEIIEQTASLLFPPEHIQIIISDNMPTFKTRKIKLQQVFQNLIGNAIKYNDKKQGLIEVGLDESRSPYCFYVKDNGPGINEDDHSRLFNLFSATQSKTFTGESSTGVGLNMLKILVEEQGGHIWMESNSSGVGCTFYFEWHI